MPTLQPFLLLPEFVERPWGTRDLSLIYPHKTARRGGEFEQPVGEVWLTGDMCRVSTGPLAGRMLGEIAREFGRLLVGEAANAADEFPLLLKFLFPCEKLSVQVHPDDATAEKQGHRHGKSECWYVIAAGNGSQVALGLKQEVLTQGTWREEVRAAIQNGRLESLLNWLELHAGDLVNVPAGTVHSIGPGPVLLEVQQNSDITYRLYDYGRPRELHVTQGLAAIKEPCGAGKVERRTQTETYGNRAWLNQARHFLVEKFVVKSEAKIEALTEKSVKVLVGLEGCGIIDFPTGGSLTLAKGEVAVIPAAISGYKIRPQWALEYMSASLP